MILGIPFYGQSFKLADENNHELNAKSFGGGTGGEFTKSEGFLSYYEVNFNNINDFINKIFFITDKFFLLIEIYFFAHYERLDLQES